MPEILIFSDSANYGISMPSARLVGFCALSISLSYVANYPQALSRIRTVMTP